MSVSEQTTQILLITCVARDSSILHYIYQPNSRPISLTQHSQGLRGKGDWNPFSWLLVLGLNQKEEEESTKPLRFSRWESLLLWGQGTGPDLARCWWPCGEWATVSSCTCESREGVEKKTGRLFLKHKF